jgi:RNA polymerase sigma-70 factor (ECF subfamily)
MDNRAKLTLSDQDLVHRVLERDGRAFEALFGRYGEMIRRHLARIVRDDAAAQDLVQEVFLRVWTRAEQWDARGSFKAWLYRIATNLALNHLRTVRRRREQPLETPADWDEEGEESTIQAWMIDASALGPDAIVELAERRESLRRLIGQLPDDKRQVIRLVHEMEVSLRDAADELGIPEGTVKSRLYYAKRRLAREWTGLDTE